jgi:hypothetical protein
MVAAAAVRPGRPRLGEDVPVTDLLAGMVAPPPLHHVRHVRDLRAEDERQPGSLDRLLVRLRHHPRMRHDRHVGELERSHERGDDRQHGLGLRLVAFKGGHHEREPAVIGEQADGDLRLEPAFLGEPALPEPVSGIGLEMQGGYVIQHQAGRAQPRMRGARRRQPLPPPSPRIHRQAAVNRGIRRRRQAGFLQHPHAVELADRLDDPRRHQL